MPGNSIGTMDVLLAHEFAERMTVDELRKWCSRNGVTRQRGDDKITTVQKAVEQNPDAVLAYLLEDEALARRQFDRAATAD